MPSANSAKVKTPAIGRSASAAWAEVWMSVTPLACSVAAVAKMMKMATTFETPIPTTVSVRMRANCGPASRGVRQSGRAPRLFRSSTSSADCQKNR